MEVPSPFHDRLITVAGQMTYRALADITGTNHESVRRYMQGQSPSAEFLSALCAKLDISGEWILTGRGPVRRRDLRPDALKQANPTELLSAMAGTLERLAARLDRLEVFVQTLETRLRADAAPAPEPNGRLAPGARDPHDAPQATATKRPQTPAPAPAPVVLRARAIANALPKRPHPDDR